MPPQVFSHTHRVTYAECTMGDHVYYSRYLDILEAARGEFFRHNGITFQQLHDAGTLFPVIDVQVRYKGAARYDDLLRVEVWISELRRVQITFGYRVLNQRDELLIEASTAHACTSTSDKLQRVPDQIRAMAANGSETL